MDLQPLLDTLAKTSGGRVLAAADIRVERDLTIVQIPVRAPNPGDRKDVALRRYAADWLKKNCKDINLEHRWQDAVGTSWYDKEGKEVPLVGLLVLTYWERPPMTEFEMLIALQRARRKGSREEG